MQVLYLHTAQTVVFNQPCYIVYTSLPLLLLPCCCRYSPAAVEVQGSVPAAIASSLKMLYSMMERGDAKMALFMFLQALHSAVPHFAERDEKSGAFKQQDAHECWSAMLTNLNSTLKTQVGRRGRGGGGV